MKMLTYWCFLLLCAVVCLSSSQEVAFGSLRLCVNDSVSVKPNSSGTIEHRQEDVQGVGSCSLMISGFERGSYISLPGIDEYLHPRCLANHPNITINNQSYCVRGNRSTNKVIIPTDGSLTVGIRWSEIKNFEFHHYSNGKFLLHLFVSCWFVMNFFWVDIVWTILKEGCRTAC